MKLKFKKTEVAQKDRQQEGYEWGGGGVREPRRIGSRQQEGCEWGVRESRRIGSRRDVSGGGGGGVREPRGIGSRRDMSGGSSKSAGSQSLHVIFCN